MGANTLAVNDGILFTGTTAYSLGGVTSSTIMPSGNASGAYDLILQQYSSGLVTVSAAIVNNSVTNLTNLVKAGPGALTLSGTNLFTGAVTIDGGTLNFGSTAISGAGTLGLGIAAVVNMRDGTTLNYTGATGTLAAGSSANSHTFNLLGGNANFNVGTSGVTLTIAGVISGAGGLTVNGPGILKLSAANTFT